MTPITLRSLQARLGKHLRPTSKGWYNFCHKKCNDKRFRLGVNFRGGRYRCFNCGANGDLHDLAPGLVGDIELPSSYRAPTPPPPTDLPWRPIRAEGEPKSLERQAIRYLESRGIPRSHAVRLGLGYGIDGWWLGRVIHPYVNARGVLAGWQGRTTYDPEPDSGERKIRFATQRDLPKGLTLQHPTAGALYLADRVQPGLPLLVCEGPYDAIHAERAIQAVALFGSNLSPAQASRIVACRPSAIYVGLDRDKAGRHWNKDTRRWDPDPRIKIARMLYVRSGVPVYIVEYPDSFEGDFGGREDKTPHPREELVALLAGARRFSPGAPAR